MRILVAFAVVILLAQATAASGAEPLKLTITSLDEQPGRLSVVVGAVDAAGQPLTGLTAANFKADINGEPVNVGDVQLASGSRSGSHILLVVDTSGSMLGEPLDRAKQAIQEFVRNLDPADAVGIVSFDSAVIPVLDFTTDRTAITQAINRLAARGDTALYDAVLEGTRRISAAPGRKLIVLLSDGQSTLAVDRRQASLDAATASGTAVVTLGLGTDIDRQYLADLAAASGGRFLEAPAPDSLRSAYLDLASSLRNQYVVTLNVPSRVDRSVSGKLTLELSSRSQTGSVERALAPLAGATPPALELLLSGIAANEKLTGPVSVTPALAEGATLASVEYRLDGGEAYNATGAPFAYQLDPAALAPGSHVLQLTALDQRGRRAEVQVPFLVPAPAGGSGLGILPLMAVLALVAACGGGAYYLMHRPRRLSSGLDDRVKPFVGRAIEPAASVEGWQVQAPRPAPRAVIDRPLGRVVVMNENALRAGEIDSIREYDLYHAPLTLGSNSSCDIQLSDEDDIAGEEARLWVQRGRLVYHKLTTLSAMATEGLVGGWAFLENNEELRIGPYRLLFQLAAEAAETSGEEPEQEQAANVQQVNLSEMWSRMPGDAASSSGAL